jgi:hypothetical protein
MESNPGLYGDPWLPMADSVVVSVAVEPSGLRHPAFRVVEKRTTPIACSEIDLNGSPDSLDVNANSRGGGGKP